MTFLFHREKPLSGTLVAELFKSLSWESARFPDRLEGILNHSTVLAAWDGPILAGLMTGLSDSLNVYFQYLCVRPEYQGRGIGSQLVGRMLSEFEDHERQTLTAVPEALEFYEKCGFHIREGKISLAAKEM